MNALNVTKKDFIDSISASLYFNIPMLEALIEKIRIDFSDRPILVGGHVTLSDEDLESPNSMH